MTRRHAGLAAALLLLSSQAAFAHPGHGDAGGLVHGFAHPLSGADHLLAMVAVGLLAAARGGRALWAVPLAFLGMMAVGGALGAAGIALPFVEAGIGLSVVAFGLAAALGAGLPLAAALALVGAFAVFHGYAHGAEMPETASGLTYGIGFLAASGLLHLAGIGLGLAAGRVAQGRALPFAGAAVAVAGVAVLAGTL
ncbi:urease accessory protein [Methylobacterium currus]|uniref:Urease accessory protein n=1 Tax=Methylobacterium currus TaxID=2051553 RepID=A0A2R4WNJ3_9HYPH|nr:HupE/UreJ family protein [Methylobacterium currus]AWB23117.1 urease accessory protein [Methylobacterium currus]UHC17148.1 HupE/UreJ family protein [Methylobacterium currus]